VVVEVGVPPATVTWRTTVWFPSSVSAAYEAIPTATAASAAAVIARMRVIFSKSFVELYRQETRFA
jgi:hypothetical protein